MIVVSDTSPITTLLQINRVGLLKDLYGDVLIPEAVRRELSVLHPSLPAFCHCVPAENRAEVERLLRELDPGEAEAIVLAKERHADALLIDESEGRSIAAREGVRFIGRASPSQASETARFTQGRPPRTGDPNGFSPF